MRIKILSTILVVAISFTIMISFGGCGMKNMI